MSLLTFSELFSETRLSQKSYGQTCGLKMILWWSSLYQLFVEKFDLTAFFPIEIPLFHGKPLSHFKPSEIYFEGFSFPS